MFILGLISRLEWIIIMISNKTPFHYKSSNNILIMIFSIINIILHIYTSKRYLTGHYICCFPIFQPKYMYISLLSFNICRHLLWIWGHGVCRVSKQAIFPLENKIWRFVKANLDILGICKMMVFLIQRWNFNGR